LLVFFLTFIYLTLGIVMTVKPSSRSSSKHPSREQVVALDIDLEIKRYNVPLATKPSHDPSDQNAPEKKLDFIGNCPKWADQELIGLFGPDLVFADFVIMGQMSRLRQNLPTSLLNRFQTVPSCGEVVYYYYRYHLARSRYSSTTRTLHSPTSKRRRIYPFVLKERADDPTGKLLTLSLKHPNTELNESQRMGQPNAALVFELILATAAWAWQTNHNLAPSHAILKILFRTKGTEAEFDYIRGKLARKDIRIYIPEEDMVRARGWVQLGGELKYEAIDDLEYSEDEGREDLIPYGFRTPYRGGKKISRDFTTTPRKDVSYKASGDHVQNSNSPSLFCLSEVGKLADGKTRRDSRRDSRRGSRRDSRGPYNQRQETNIQRIGSRIKRSEAQGPYSPSRPRLSTTILKGAPISPGGTSNHILKMDREFDKFWPGGQQAQSMSWLGLNSSSQEPPPFPPLNAFEIAESENENIVLGERPSGNCCIIS